MQAGRMRERVTVEELTEVRSASGQATRQWSPAFTCWARVRDIRGSERFAAVRPVGTEAAIFEVRARLGFRPQPTTHRLVHDGQTYNIVGVAHTYNSDGWEISAEAALV